MLVVLGVCVLQCCPYSCGVAGENTTICSACLAHCEAKKVRWRNTQK